MGIGLQNEATITIHFQTDGTELKELKAVLQNLGKAINAETIARQFDALSDEIKELKRNVGNLSTENAHLKGELEGMTDEYKKNLAAAKAAGKAAAEEAKKAASATKMTKKEEEDRRRAIEQLRRALTGEAAAQQTLANGLASLLQKRRAEAAAAKTQAAELARSTAEKNKKAAADQKAADAAMTEARALVANSKARQAHNEELEEEKRRRAEQRAIVEQMMARFAQEDDALAQANAERRRSTQIMATENAQRRMLAIVVAQGNDFQKRNAQLIGQITNARRGDIKAIREYIAALRNAISVENQRKDRLQGFTATGTKMGFIDTLKERMSDAEKSVDALFRASYRLQMVGNTLQNVGRNIIRLGNEVMTTFGDFEFMLNRARGALQVWHGGTIDGADGATVLTEAVVGLSQELKVLPAKDVAQGLFYWSAATGQVVESQTDLNLAMSAIEPIMKAAIMTNTSYEATIKGVYSILTQYYNGSLEKAAYVTEQLFYTTQTTAAEFDDLIQSFKMVGPVAAQMGVSFEEVNMTLGKLADLGIRGTMAGRGLRQLFIQTAKPSGPAMKAIEKVWRDLSPDVFGGKSFMEVMFPEGEFVGITKQMTYLAQATEHLDTAQRAALLAAISTANMLPITSALVAQQRLELHGLTEEVTKYTNAGDRAAKFFAANWKLLDTSWNALKGSIDRAVDAIRISIGGIMSDALRPFIEAIQAVLDKFNEFIKANPELVAAIGKVTAALAAGAGLAGAIFIVMGALTGLGAAISFTGKSFSLWAGIIGQVVGALGFLFTALFDNFNYLQRAAGEIMDNLTSAFGAAEESIVMLGSTAVAVTRPAGELHDVIISLGEAFMKITAPARELAGLIVRVVADLAVNISKLIAASAGIPFVTEALQGLVLVLGTIASAKIIGGLLALANSVKTFLAVAVVSKIKAVGNAILFLGAATSKVGVGAGIKGLGLALSALMGGPLGLVGLGLTVGFLALEAFPQLGDALSGVADGFANVSENVSKTVDSMGAMGPAILAQTMRFLNADTEQLRGLQDKKKALQDSQQQIVDFVQSGVEWTPETKNEIRRIAEQAGLQWSDDLTTALDNGLTVHVITAIDDQIRATTGELDRLANEPLADANALMEQLRQQYADYASRAAENLEGIVRTEEDFNNVVAKLQAGAYKKNKLTSIGTLVTGLFNRLPEFFTEQELRDLLKNDPFFKNLDSVASEAVVSALRPLIGDASTQINKEIIAAMDKGFSMTDPIELESFMNSILPGFNLSLMDMRGMEIYGDLHDDIDRMVTQHMNLLGEEMEIPTSVIEERLKTVMKNVTAQATEDIAPIMNKLSQELVQMSLTGGPEGMEQMAQALLEATLPSGENLLKALTEGNVGIGPSGPLLLEIAKHISSEGAGGPALAAIVKEQVTEDFEDVAQATLQGITDGLEGKLTMESVREAMKKGSGKVQFDKLMGELIGKPLQAAFGKRGNIQSKILGRTRLGEIGETMIQRMTMQSGRRRAGLATRLVKFFDKNFEKMPQAAQRSVLGTIDKMRGIPGVERIVDKFIKPGPLRRAMNAAIEEALAPTEGQKSPFQQAIDNFLNPQAGGATGTTPSGAGIAPIIQGALGSTEALTAVGTETANTVVAGVVSGLAVEGNATLVANGILALVTSAVALVYTFVNPAVKPVGTAVVGGIAPEISAEVSIASVSSAINLLIASAVGRVLESARALAAPVGSSAVSGIADGIRSSQGAIQSALSGTILLASIGVMFSAFTWGSNIGESWGSGVAAGIRSSVGDIKAAQDEIKPVTKDGSPPKEGPLKDFDKWGEGVGKSWGEGVGRGMAVAAKRNMRRVQSALRDGNRDATGRAEIKSTRNNVVKVKVEVTSPDGSVDRVKAGQLRKGLLEAFSLAGIEHMVTVG